MRLSRVRFTVRRMMVAVGAVAVALSLWIWFARARYWLDEADRWALHEQLEMREAIEREKNAEWARALVARGEKRAGLAPSASRREDVRGRGFSPPDESRRIRTIQAALPAMVVVDDPTRAPASGEGHRRGRVL